MALDDFLVAFFAVCLGWLLVSAVMAVVWSLLPRYEPPADEWVERAVLEFRQSGRPGVLYYRVVEGELVPTGEYRLLEGVSDGWQDGLGATDVPAYRSGRSAAGALGEDRPRGQHPLGDLPSGEC